jgi:undecaprenyl-diphosphatase
LEIGKWLLGNNLSGEESLLMTVVLHVATAISTIIVFRQDILLLLKNLFSKDDMEGRNFALKIVISMIPAVMVGLTLEKEIDALFTGQLLLVGTCLLITGLLLLWADRPFSHQKPLSYKSALWIGIAQAIAILPGISRSGATISTALLLKVDRAQAARFSFLMVVPLILGKIAKDMLDGSAMLSVTNQGIPLLAGFFAALITGWLACKWMITIVQRAKLNYFGYYCFIVGSLAILSSIIW